MSENYAKNRPDGFNNRIERVAIAGGSIGQHLAKALLGTGKHTVTAITRAGSTSKIPSGAKAVAVDYEDEDSIVAAIKGQQFLLISMSTAAPRGTQEKLIQAAAKAGVSWVMPNCYGTDFTNISLGEEGLTRQAAMTGITAAEEAGVSWIAMGCSFWYELSLAQSADWFGFDLRNNQRKITFYDDGKTRFQICAN
ncbi:hypothetical protein NW754_007856 [Fusarium falciforme]|uniref:NAD(P)-binding domain-containing protein n=1 Tax=Fusarium falciforme TaxID=195108 RepID=A0A9W8UU05_9HYPO|nr:hypothetical protein NW754_007856 [Fusarium falciforme]KAJ4178273.1 hypothetical protein NW755_013285 [Fusarium falciforme]KAJ4238411.1 hypothetical protein NW757_013111 [Fusarium falciforme]